MKEPSAESFARRHTTELTVGAIGATAAILAGWGILHQRKDELPSDPAESLYRRQAVILNEERLDEERRAHINRLAALFVVRRRLTAGDILTATEASKHASSKSLGYLRDYELVGKVQPRRKPVPVAGHYIVTPALDWAATQKSEYADLARSLEVLRRAEGS